MSNVVIGQRLNADLHPDEPYNDSFEQSAEIVRLVKDVLEHQAEGSTVDYVIVSRDNGECITRYQITEQHPTDGLLHDLAQGLQGITDRPHTAAWIVVQTLRELGIIDPEVDE